VGTVTEIYDYLRLLFGRAGDPHCPHCDRSHFSPEPRPNDGSGDGPAGPYPIPNSGSRGAGQERHPQKLLSALAAEGFVRVRVNGEIRELNDNIELDKNHAHTIEVVVDRLVKKDDLAGALGRFPHHLPQAIGGHRRH
jgi:excinuclease ABC subunit A